MSDQLTQCPHCQTSFRVTANQLAAAGGLVRCGSCLGLFSASINFIRMKPEPGDDPDDILLGDLDLDSLDGFGDEADGDILFADPAHAQAGRADDDYELYEEYAETPDLFADLRKAPDAGGPAATRNLHEDDSGAEADADTHADFNKEHGETTPPAFTSAAEDAAAVDEPDDSDDTDWLNGPSEEFRPRTILFDDDDDDAAELDDVDARDAADARSKEAFAPLLTDARQTAAARHFEFADDAETSGFDDIDDTATAARLDDDAVAFDTTELEVLLQDDMDTSPTPEPDTGDHDDRFDSIRLGELTLDELDGSSGAMNAPAASESEYDEEYDEDDADESTAYTNEDNPGDTDDADGDEDEDVADAEAILEEYMEAIHVDPLIADAEDAPVARRDQSRQSGRPEWLQQPAAPKAELHRYLAALEDEDELEPLGAQHLDELDEEPVLLSGEGRGRSLLANAAMLLLCLALTGSLALQFVDRHLEALRQRSSFARFEPWFCRVLDCPPVAAADAPATDTANLYSQELLVRTHPRLQGALEVSFVFRNDGDTPQPFPGLELNFRNIDNELLANRLFLPTDYLPPELRPLQAMPAHSTVQVNLELVDPGAAAVNYTIAFRDL